MSKWLMPCGLLAMCIVSFPAFAGKVVSVDCDNGENLTEQLLGKSKELLTIEFVGTCVEDLNISRGNLTIRGLDSSATIQGAVRIDGPAPSESSLLAGPVVLENLTIIFSSTNGLTVGPGNVVTARGLASQQNTLNGLQVFGGGFLRCIDCGSTGNGGDGIQVLSSGSVEIAGVSDFSSNTETGISVGGSGSVSLFSLESGAPDIADISANNNGQDGIQVFDGGSILSADFTNITANGNGTTSFGSGILVGTGASGLLSGQIITDGNDAGVYSVAGKLLFFGNVVSINNTIGLFANNNGTLRLAGSENIVTGNVQGARVDGSFLQLFNASFGSNSVDVALLFGAKARLTNSTPTSVSCDGTQLLTGATCSP